MGTTEQASIDNYSPALQSERLDLILNDLSGRIADVRRSRAKLAEMRRRREEAEQDGERWDSMS